MRPYLFGLFAIILFGLWWYLDTLLATQGWATMEGGQWGPTSTGWKIIPAAWPLALVGVLGGGSLALVLVFVAWNYVEDEDHSKEIADLQKELMAAEIRATQADAMAITEAKRLVQAEKQEVAQLKQQAVREMERNKQVAADLAVMQLQVQTQAIAAQADVEQANRRTRNATATSQRRANKLAKLKTQS
ncbi:hypothetical protein [Aeromonas caviae]|uniref:hypothetical protein n=1 Tax=Aeromonas caviae TaxID=648 RepID=UPI002F4283B2